MTSRTHDLAAFTAANWAFWAFGPIPMSLSTLIVAGGANFLGGLFPDLDQTTSRFWGNIRGGSFLSRLASPLLGGHRLITHSFLGLILTGFLLNKFLALISSVLLVDMGIVWAAFMLGHVSHLIADSFTKEGVPWLFPFPWQMGIPPIEALRVKTGSVVEKSFIFPSLMLGNGYMFYLHYQELLKYLQTLGS